VRDRPHRERQQHPPPQAPSAQLLLARYALESGADPAAFQVLPCPNAVAQGLATDRRVRVLSFTGSAAVGWQLKSKAAGAVLLELGGNAGALVCADADLDWAAERLALSAFNCAGQVCIKVQRVLVERAVWAPFAERFVARARALPVGDPRLPDTVVGPLVDDAAAERVSAWVLEAERAGARTLLRGERKGRVMPPVVLADVPADAKVRCEEVFGPVAVLGAVDDFAHGLRELNDSRYGLQAAVFTRDLGNVRTAFRELEVGGVIVNDAPSFRTDNFPYGGAKDSGLGREGARAAMDAFTEPRVLVTRSPPLR